MFDVTNAPLISVIVFTYNSSNYILETLDSIRNQTYKKIELIITDDCSSDRTIALCRDWIKKYSNQFYNCELITTDYNTGISPNCNRGIKIAKGEWVKMIAGDDILVEDALEKYLNYIITHENTEVIHGNIESFNSNNRSDRTLIKPSTAFIKSDKENQYKLLLKENQIFAPSALIKKTILINNLYFDEKYKWIEDYPFWLKVSSNGTYFSYLDFTFTLYRRHDEAISSRKNDVIYNPIFIYEEDIKIDLIYPNAKKMDYLFQKVEYLRKIFMYKYDLNRNTKQNRTLNKILIAINIFRYFSNH